jgi:hypothetical protein
MAESTSEKGIPFLISAVDKFDGELGKPPTFAEWSLRVLNVFKTIDLDQVLTGTAIVRVQPPEAEPGPDRITEIGSTSTTSAQLVI